MTALVVSLLFLFSLVAIPLVAAIPTYASYLALVVVGLIMLARGITEVNWEQSDWLIPGGLTMVMMPLDSVDRQWYRGGDHQLSDRQSGPRGPRRHPHCTVGARRSVCPLFLRDLRV